jgi:Phosphotransferase enzyme family
MALELDPKKTDRPYPAREGRLPRNLAAVTPAWLSALLAHRYPGIEVESFEQVELINSHTTKLRLSLELNEVGRRAGIPRNVCLKSNWSEGIGTGDICELEARFYHLLGQPEVDVAKAPLPKSYYADWDGDGGGRGIVVLEDLALAPGRFGNSRDQLGVDGVAEGLESLAALHLALWDSPSLSQLPGSMATPRDSDQMLLLWNYIAMNINRPSYRAFLPDWIYEAPERLAHAFDELGVYERGASGPKCVVHGDSHQGNSYLRESGERIWLDWQLARRGHPWRDLSYFAVGALSVEERRGSMRDLVEEHRRRLVAGGASGVPSREDAWEHFRLWPVYGMQCWLGNVDQWGQSSAEMVERFVRAVEDFDSIDLLTAGKAPPRAIALGEGAAKIDERTRKQLESLP